MSSSTVISGGRGAACSPAPALCPPRRRRPLCPGRSPALVSSGAPPDITRLRGTTRQAVNSQSHGTFAGTLTAFLLSKPCLTGQRCPEIHGWKPTAQAFPADPQAGPGPRQTSCEAGAAPAGNCCAEHAHTMPSSTRASLVPCSRCTASGWLPQTDKCRCPRCCLVIPGWDRDSDMSEGALNRRSSSGSQRSWLLPSGDKRPPSFSGSSLSCTWRKAVSSITHCGRCKTCILWVSFLWRIILP